MRFMFSRLYFSLRTTSSRVFCNAVHESKKSPLFATVEELAKDKTNLFSYRTHNCGQLRLDDTGKRVTLFGWLHYNRGKFFVLRDVYGTTQILVPGKFVKEIKKLSYESVLKVEGIVTRRPDGQENTKMATGMVEIAMDGYEVLNRALPQMPFEFRYEDEPTDEIRLRYRYLDLRRDDSQRILRFRSDLIQRIRRFLHEQCSFVEVETPTLFRRTPGGAAEFVVPSSDWPGKFYCLPQSPQQYKQLLMVGGVDRYFQIAKCYRDEGARSDRQPEFTQVDIELSFTSQKDVMALVENVMMESWPEEMRENRPRSPFPVMAYQDAMNRYGSDKPDIRFGMEVVNLDQIGQDSLFCIVAPYKFEDSEMVEEWRRVLAHQHSYSVPFEMVHVNVDETGVVEWRPFESESGILNNFDIDFKTRFRRILQSQNTKFATVFFAASNNEEKCSKRTHRQFCAQRTLGFIRLRLVEYLETKGYEIRRKDQFAFLWVIDFPLFLPTETAGRWESAHHPFTAPIPEHTSLLRTHPHRCIGQHYDLVMNGVELGGGSIRIHHAQLQKYVLEDILREDSSELKHLLDALACGAPPHGGFAIGLDRYLAVLLGKRSIRDVIAFPKTMAGRDPLCDAPAALTAQQLARYHITVDEKPQ